MRGLIVVIGSGELGPSMTSTHRQVLERTGARSVTVLDSSYGFQANADDLTDRITSHFVNAFGVGVKVASLRRPDASEDERDQMLGDISRSEVVFAGPGSPSYALRVWSGLDVRAALLGVIDRGGAVVMASAAALTLGSKTIPVYEIYKVGDDLHWLDGLDLLSEFGLKAVVVPHWNNREGGFHDTSHCFIGEARFQMLMDLLPEQMGVLGVDEHTSVTLDAESGTMTVRGVGKAHLNDNPIGDTHSLTLPPRPPPTAEPDSPPEYQNSADQPVLADHLIDLVVEIRARARDRGDFEESDRLRDELAELDIELRDGVEGTSWQHRPR